MRRLDVSGLPDDPLAAAAVFYAQWVGQIDPPRNGEDIVLIFPAADHTHTAWRLAAVQGLARSHAPVRVNAVAGGDGAAVAAALAYLEGAPGLTGQYLPLDGTGAGPVVTSAA
jgi:hypothetical protein